MAANEYADALRTAIDIAQKHNMSAENELRRIYIFLGALGAGLGEIDPELGAEVRAFAEHLIQRRQA